MNIGNPIIELEKIDLTLQEFMRVSKQQAVSIPNCKSVGKLHVLIRPVEWWLEKLIYHSDYSWKIVATEPATKGGEVAIFIRS